MPYTLIIKEKNNSWAGRAPRVSEHPTLDDARNALLTYVRENWGTEVGTEEPTDKDDLVSEYFSDALEEYELIGPATS